MVFSCVCPSVRSTKIDESPILMFEFVDLYQSRRAIKSSYLCDHDKLFLIFNAHLRSVVKILPIFYRNYMHNHIQCMFTLLALRFGLL